MQNKMAKIKEKGFVMNLAKDTDDRYEPTNFGKIRLGLQTLSDATVEYGELKKINAQYATKANVLKAINDKLNNIINTSKFDVSLIAKEIKPGQVNDDLLWKNLIKDIENI